MFSRCEVHYNIETNIANEHVSISMMDKKRNSLSFHFDVFFSSFHVCTIASCVSGFRLALHFVSVRHQVKLQLFHLQKDHFTSGTQSWRRLKKLVKIILLQKPKVDIILFEEAGRDNSTSETQSWHHLKKLVEIILLQKSSWRHFVWKSWTRSFYFRNPKSTSFYLMKLVEII